LDVSLLAEPAGLPPELWRAIMHCTALHCAYGIPVPPTNIIDWMYGPYLHRAHADGGLLPHELPHCRIMS
jgi:hypothetical protein